MNSKEVRLVANAAITELADKFYLSLNEERTVEKAQQVIERFFNEIIGSEPVEPTGETGETTTPGDVGPPSEVPDEEPTPPKDVGPLIAPMIPLDEWKAGDENLLPRLYEKVGEIIDFLNGASTPSE